MKVITCHVNADFDAFSSMVAAQKLYPDAKMVFSGVVSKEVKQFLILYKDLFEIVNIKDINIKDIEQLIIVDTNSKSRIGDFAKIIDNPYLYKCVYDHHPTVDTRIEANEAVIENIGANTTIMVNEIIKKHIEIDQVEATILALGIYFDTNCLTFSSTTAKDAYALAYLIEKGANLSVVNSYMEHRLSKEQEELFFDLIRNIEILDINNLCIGISKIELPEYVGDVAFLTRKILEVRGYDGMFSIVKMGNKTYVVGRSKTDSINVGNIMRNLGGAGHPRAASATVKDEKIELIYERLINIIHENVKTKTLAKDIMTYPVKVIQKDATINEAKKMILRYGHTGIPIVENEKLIGIITRSDIEKALAHGFGQSPIKAYMSKNVVVIDEDYTTEEIKNTFVENNIGRVPVLKNGNIIGIITRTDLLNMLHGEASINNHRSLYRLQSADTEQNDENKIVQKIFSLKEDIRNILLEVGRLGDKNNVNVYVVGGFVRDLILDLENRDIDIVVEGNGLEFAKELGEILNCSVTLHNEFKTAVLKGEGLEVDIVTARAEYYKQPAALPTISVGSIKDDLYRRDFTINSMAISLNEERFGSLVDYFGGLRDLKEKKVKILHNLSFVDDPTRIFRAIKFEQRYSFKMEEETMKFAKKAIQDGMLSHLSIERIWFEIHQIIKEDNVAEIFSRMNEIGLFKLVFKVEFSKDKYKFIKYVYNYLKSYEDEFNIKNLSKDLMIYTAIFSDMDYTCFETVKNTIKLPKNYISSIENFIVNINLIKNFFGSKKLANNYELYKVLKLLTDTNIAIILYIYEGNDIVVTEISRYLKELKDICLSINGKYIINLGVKPGPEIKNILEAVLELKINGSINTFEEEIEAVKDLIKNN